MSKESFFSRLKWLGKGKHASRGLDRAVEKERIGAHIQRHDRAVIEPPSPSELPAPELPAEVLRRVEGAVVVIERLDSAGRQEGAACGFVDARGLVVTNRHCIEGAAGLKLNLGAAGIFDLRTLVGVSEELDIALLEGEFPREAVGRLEWAEGPPREHSPVAMVVRDTTGKIASSTGWSGRLDFDYSGAIGLSTSVPAWMGSSGSPLMDFAGRVVGVTNRLGEPIPGRARATTQAALCTDVVGLSLAERIPVSEWADGGKDAGRARFEKYERAAMHIAARDPARSAEQARAALKIRPHDVRVTGILSNALDRLHRSEEAVTVLKELAAARPRDWRPNFVLGNRQGGLRRFAEAIGAYEKSIAIEPRAVVWFWLGTSHWWQRDWRAAARAYEEVVRMEPRHSRSWEGLSRLYAMLGSTEEMVGVAERRLKSDPENPVLLASLASALLKAGRAKEHAEVVSRLRGMNAYLANRAGLLPEDWSSFDGKQGERPG